jgi:glyoxylase-like metal-dependent hydrolase (beta-lactamase superfamily II)
MDQVLIDIQKITETIFLIEGENRGKFPFSHSVLIKDDVCGLIDTGCGLEQLKKIHALSPDIILNSHSHIDHTSGNWYFPHTPLVVPQQEYEFNGNLTLLSERYVNRELASSWRKFVTKVSIFKDAEPTRPYDDGDIFDFGTTSLEAIHTPGHCLGHHCFFEREERVLFSSDIDLTRFGPWYGNEESDIDQFLQSIERVRALCPEILLSAHSGMIQEDIDSNLVKFAQIIEHREEKIYSFLTKERTVEEIVDEAFIYRKFPYYTRLLRYWEGVMVLKHLHRLIKKGLVMRTDRGYRREG